MVQKYQSKGRVLQGTLNLLILQVLADGPGHGYEVLRRIRERSRDVFDLEEGTLYPALHRLEKNGFLKSRWDQSDANRRAKYYSLTARRESSWQLKWRIGSRYRMPSGTSWGKHCPARADHMSEQESLRHAELIAPGGRIIDPAILREEIEEELQLHIDLLTEDLIREGMSPETAQQKAVQKFGEKDVICEQCFCIQTRETIMFHRIHVLLTLALLISVIWLGTLVRQKKTSSTIEHVQAVVCDSSRSTQERLQNLNWLRFYGPPDARNSDVVLAMIELVKNTDEPQLRADIFRQLDEVTLPALKETLLVAVVQDSSAEVREEAAESLGPFSNEEDVRQALEKVRDQDANPRVRQQAAASLLRNASAAEAKEVVLNASLPQEERLFALRGLRSKVRSNGDPRDHEVIQAMIALAESTEDAYIRADIFRNLDEVTDPILEAPLLEALANDPSDEVRSEAAETLAHYLDSPKVVEALKAAATDDEGSTVRAEAQRSLRGMH